MKLYYHTHESMYDRTRYWVFMEPGRYKETWRAIGYLYSESGSGKAGPNSLTYDRKPLPSNTAPSAYRHIANIAETRFLIRTIFNVDKLRVDKAR